MILKKFSEFLIKESINQKDLFINKEDLIEKMKGVSSDINKWGIGEDHLSYDLREVFYNMWQDDSNSTVNDRETMVNYALETYGIIPAFVLLVSGYIGQVNNGGHSQYMQNGYASISANRHGDGEDTQLHEMLLQLWEESGFNIFSKSGKQSFEIAKQFEIDEEEDECEYCGGSGEEDEEDEDGNIDSISCGNCGGSGTDSYNTTFHVVNGKDLDNKLYDVNTRFHYDMERFLAKHLID